VATDQEIAMAIEMDSLRDRNQRKILLSAISWQRPTTNIKPDMVCVKLIEITE